jgi:hypothetical protein
MNSDGVVVDIALLRSPDWFQQCGAVVGATIPLSISELGLDGPAQVVSIEPCPTLKPGSGRVVTGTFSHDSSGVMDLKVDGRADPIGVTQGHLVYSLDHHAFVPVGDLAVGESLSPLSDGGRVTSLSRRPGVHRVYNLEVNVEHVYHVTELGILVHNGCPKASPKGAGGGGGAPKGFPRTTPRLEEGNLKEGWKHIDARHVSGTAPGGAGDLFAPGTTRAQIEAGAKQLVAKGNRISDPSRQIQTFEKHMTINGKSARYRVVVDSADGNRIITMFPVEGGS